MAFSGNIQLYSSKHISEKKLNLIREKIEFNWGKSEFNHNFCFPTTKKWVRQKCSSTPNSRKNIDYPFATVKQTQMNKNTRTRGKPGLIDRWQLCTNYQCSESSPVRGIPSLLKDHQSVSISHTTLTTFYLLKFTIPKYHCFWKSTIFEIHTSPNSTEVL